MATSLPPPLLSPLPTPPTTRPTRRWQRPFRYLRLRLRAWLVTRAHGDAHPVAVLIARGDWAALDRLVDDLDRDR
jgi:hypothetical protein